MLRNKSNKTVSSIFLLAIIFLIALALWVKLRPPTFETDILNLLANHRAAWLDNLVRGITRAGSFYVVFPVLMLVTVALYLRSHVRQAIFILIGFACTVVLNHVLKFLIARPRPDLHPALIDTTSVYAFPSSHATQVTVMALLLFLVVRQLKPAWQWVAALLSAFLVITVALSRLYLQVHYPLDVVAGILTALVAVLGCDLVVRQRCRKNIAG